MRELSHQVAKIMELQLQHQSFQWFRADFLEDWQVWSPCVKGLSRVFSSTMVRKHQFFSAQSSLWSKSHLCTWLLEKPSVQSSHSVMSDSLWPHGLQHARLPCPSLSPGVCSNSYPLSQWCYLTISSSAAHFFGLQSCPALGFFLINWLFTSGGRSIAPSAAASVLPMNIQGWFPLGWTGWIFL